MQRIHGPYGSPVFFPHGLSLINHGQSHKLSMNCFSNDCLDSKLLIEMMSTQNNVHIGKRFQPCGMPVRKIVVGRQDLSLLVSCSMGHENKNKLLKN